MRQITLSVLSFFMASLLVLGSISVVEAKNSAKASHGQNQGRESHAISDSYNQKSQGHPNQGGNSSHGNSNGSQANDDQVSLEVSEVSVSTNTCEQVAGTFKVTNTSSNSSFTTGVFAVLQAHVPPSRGGQSHFFEIRKIQVSDFSLTAGETKTISYSITGFTIPQNTNSIRVEIQVNIPGRDKTFISRSESFKPCTGSGTGGNEDGSDNGGTNNGSQSTSSTGSIVTASSNPQVQPPSVLANITQQPATGSNLLLSLALYTLLLVAGVSLKKFSDRIFS